MRYAICAPEFFSVEAYYNKKLLVMYFKKVKILPLLTLQAKLMEKKPQIFGQLSDIISGRNRSRQINFTGIACSN